MVRQFLSLEIIASPLRTHTHYKQSCSYILVFRNVQRKQNIKKKVLLSSVLCAADSCCYNEQMQWELWFPAETITVLMAENRKGIWEREYKKRSEIWGLCMNVCVYANVSISCLCVLGEYKCALSKSVNGLFLVMPFSGHYLNGSTIVLFEGLHTILIYNWKSEWPNNEQFTQKW